ncbi:hypothetical protein TIFTF001_024633 [Ficus carica]|uniref:Uncharacterized protein n=1 Tax=Ficus carica TaxID=3494 RepID=A0AA88AH58_FICCA|nr:hypothetical protein TIFTF001_024633 [Ficus carica]
MGVTGKGATVLVRAGDRRMVVSDGTGARLVSAMKEEGGSKRPMLVLVLLLGSRCSEHYTVRAHGPFRREQGRWSAKDPVLRERPALNTAEYCRRQYFVVGEYVDINMSEEEWFEKEKGLALSCSAHGLARSSLPPPPTNSEIWKIKKEEEEEEEGAGQGGGGEKIASFEV